MSLRRPDSDGDVAPPAELPGNGGAAAGQRQDAREAERKAAVVLLNVSAGALTASDAETAARRVADAFAAEGVSAVVTPVDRLDLERALRAAAESDAELVVVGGGDGSLSTAAAALAGGAKPLGILPLGTLNHFARDLGIPVDLGEAVRTIAAGRVRSVDVGEVNGRVFLNNSSIGLYPEVVDDREELRQRRGAGKWLAMVYALVSVFRRLPLLTVTLRLNGGSIRLRTPFVFVGNNAYEISFLSLGRRQALDGGELSVYVARHGTRLGLLRLALLALLGRLEQDRDFQSLALDSLEIETRRRALRVSADGEVVYIASPIRYRVRPAALRVFAPPAP
jgi:diacylglycerol kinase family enzyme